MSAAGRHLSVILMSLAVIFASGGATYLVWLSLSAVETISRDVVSLFSWVLTFYIGSFLMWRGVIRISRAT